MKRENDEITDLFRARLGHAEMMVKEGFWEELNQDVTVCSQHRRRIAFFRVAAAASVLLVLAATSAAFWFFSPKEEMEQAFTQLAVSGMGDLNGDQVNQSFSPAHTQPVLQQPSPGNYTVLAQQSEEDAEDDSITMTMSFSFSVSSSTVEHENVQVEGENNVWKTGVKNETFDNSGETAHNKKLNREVVKADGRQSFAVKAAIGTALPAVNGVYKMPVEVNVTAEKRFNKYLGVEAGLAYTNLRSTGQSLHYVGIPVKMNLHLAETSKLDLYASIGGVADKCIAGAPSNSFKNEPVQLALTAGIGVNYKINDRIALFAEPGISHHFKTDSDIETIRTKRPTNFNLMCGLRMTY